MKTFILILSALVSLQLHAKSSWESISSTDFIVQPPPAVGSPEYKQDFELLHEWQNKRTKADCQEAKHHESGSLDAIFAQTSLTEKELDRPSDLVRRAQKIAGRVSSYYKSKFSRPRPFNTDKTIKPCITRPGGSKAYPSGHATSAATAGCLYAAIYPERADELFAAGLRGGELRLIGGVHHPSDVEAGQKLGNEVCERLLQDEEFLEELEKVSPN